MRETSAKSKARRKLVHPDCPRKDFPAQVFPPGFPGPAERSKQRWDQSGAERVAKAPALEVLVKLSRRAGVEWVD
jgi:hypothetical protein